MSDLQKLNDVKTYLRDLKFKLILENNNNITLSELPFSHFNNFFEKLFYPKRLKYLNTLLKLDSILTGSSALISYRYKGERIFNRSMNDFDFIISRDNFVSFCGIYNLNKVVYEKNFLSLNVNTGRYRGYDHYGNYKGYSFGCDYDLIGTDKKINYTIHNGCKVQNFLDIIHSKLELAEKYDENQRSDEKEIYRKHINDLWNIITRISAIDSGVDSK